MMEEYINPARENSKPVNLNGALEGMPVYTPVNPNTGKSGTAKLSFDDMINGIETSPQGAGFVKGSDIYSGDRYKSTYVGRDAEEMHAQQQGSLEKWGSGAVKFLGTTTTAFLTGTVGTVAGLAKMATDQKFSSFYDNAVNRSLDDFNKKLEDWAPNYYTQAERDAKWYSSDNIFTANFWADKVLKNLGYSAGTLAGGFVWGSALKAIGLTSKLMLAGKSMETVTAIDTAIATAPKAARFGAVSETLTGLSNQFLKPIGASILNNSERGIISAMGTMGEAGLEALQNMNEFRETLVKEYVDKYGVEPEGVELDEINKYADKVGNFTWGMNVALLSVTNYIQLPKILNSSKAAEKRGINRIVEETLEDGSRKFAKKSFAESIAGKPGRLFSKYVYTPASLFINPIEGFEEGSQFAIQKGTNDYFHRGYENHDDVSSFWQNFKGSGNNVVFGKGIQEALSTKEGLENILIGAISGGLQTSFSPFGQNTIKEKGFFGDGGKQGKNTDLAVTALNKKNLTTVLQDFKKYFGIAMASQDKRQTAIANDDKLNEKDYEQDYTLAYIIPRVKHGRSEQIKQELDLYKQQALTEAGFKELQTSEIALQNETSEQFVKRLEDIRKTTEQVEKTFDLINDKYANIYDEKGKRIYDDTVVEKMVYASAKIINIDGRLADLSSNLFGKNVDLNTIDNAIQESEGWKTNDIKKIISDPAVNTALQAGIEKIKADNLLETDELEQDFIDYAELVTKRKMFIDEYNQMRETPLAFAEVPVTPSSVPTNKETITIKTKKGERQIELNEEYYLGKVVDYTPSGEEVLNPKIIKILGVNEDGTINIEDQEDKKVIKVSPEKLEEFKLGKVSTASKKGKFVIDMYNKVFIHRGIKDAKGKYVKGRISHSPLSDKLKFTYVNSKGKKVTILVKNTQFKAQKGFNKPMIQAVGEFTTKEKKSLEDLLSTPDNESLGSPSDIEARTVFLASLKEEAQERLESVNEKLSANKEALDKNAKELEEARKSLVVTNKGTIRKKGFATVRKTISNLAKLQDTLNKERDELIEEKAMVDYMLPFYTDQIDALSENKGDNKEVLDNLKKDVALLEDFIDISRESIEKNTNLLKLVNELLQNSLKLYADYLKRLKEENPNLPFTIDELQANVEKYLGEEGAELFIKERQGFTNQVMQLELDIRDFEQELSIPDLANKTDKIIDDIQELNKGVDLLIQEQESLANLLEKFETFVKARESRIEEEKVLAENSKIKFALLQTSEKRSIQTKDSNDNYEELPKKPTHILPNSTAGKMFGKEYQTRANTFGKNLDSFSNRNDIRGVYVTKKNQGKLIKGLIEFLNTEAGGILTMDTIIALVMVNNNGKLIGVDGLELTEEQLEDPINHAIFQTFPEAGLKWSEEYGGQTMFRKGTPENVQEKAEQQYAKWREEVLDQDSIGERHTIGASFGILDLVRDAEGKVDYSTRTAVKEAGLVSDEDLEKQNVLYISTTQETVSHALSTFMNAIGKPFLRLKNGLVPLQNKKHSKEEASAIYDSIHRLAELVLADSKNLKTGEGLKILNFLKSVVYWGIPTDQQNRRKPAGYNSIFFEQDEETEFLVLQISKDKKFLFSPSELEINKTDIIEAIQGIHNNINSSKLKNVNDTFEQILSIDSKGEITSIIWPNYQTYLLSDKLPDENGEISSKSKDRKSDIPLTTVARPLKNEEDVNRKDIYFYTQDTLEDYAYADIAKSVKKAKATVAKKKTTTKKVSAVSKLKEEDTETSRVIFYKGGKYTITSKEGKGVITDSKGKVIDNKSELAAAIIKLFREGKGDIKKAQKKASDDIMGSYTIEDDDLDEQSSDGIEDAEIIEEEDDDEISFDVLKQKPKNAKEESKNTESVRQRIDKNRSKKPRLREYINKKLKSITVENWNNVDKWMKTNLPFIPLYRVKNVIQATNGKQAWGMFKEGAIYVYNNAETGTSYHEAFEYVWGTFLSREERISVNEEFKNRNGEFLDRPSQTKIKFSEADNDQIREQLAEEFRDFILQGTLPKTKSLIEKFFHDLITFIKEFFTGKNAGTNTEILFKNIGSGYYAKALPMENSTSFGARGFIEIENAFAVEEDSLREKIILSDRVRGEIIDHMIYTTIAHLIGSDESLFKDFSENKKELLAMLEEEIFQTIAETITAADISLNNEDISSEEHSNIVEDTAELLKNVGEQWDNIVNKFEEKLIGYGIEFDENDDIQRNDEDQIRESNKYDATKIDNYKKTNSAIKLLIGSIPKVDENGDDIYSSIGGVVLLPNGQAFITLLNNLSNSLSTDDMLMKLKEVAKNDANYRTLYKRISKQDWNSEDVGYTIEGVHSLQLLSAFWKSFKKYNSAVKIVSTLENGETTIGEAHLLTGANQLRNEYINSIIAKAKKAKARDSYFEFDKVKKVYTGNKEKVRQLNLGNKAKMSEFLTDLGIPFTQSEISKIEQLSPSDYNRFKEAVYGIKSSILAGEDISTFSGKALSISSRLIELGRIRMKLTNPMLDSTYYNINGDQTQSFINPNVGSMFFEFIQSIPKLTSEFFNKQPHYSYLLTDTFTQNSVILNRMFTKNKTKKTDDTGEIEKLLQVGYSGGIDNKLSGKQKQSSKLNFKERLLHELNLNLSGWYLNLVPGDSTLEHMTYLGNEFKEEDLSGKFEKVLKVFKGYFIDEFNMIKELDREVASGRDNNEFRFFKAILGENAKKIAASEKSAEETYAQYEKVINDAVIKYIKDTTKKLKITLKRYNVLQPGKEENTLVLNGVEKSESLVEAAMDDKLNTLTANYMVANIEFHKLIYSDPYQYMDELKRIKSSNSPRQMIIGGMDDINDSLQKVWNNSYQSKKDIGWTDFLSGGFRTVTLSDIISKSLIHDYLPYKETDGAGIIMFNAYRQLRIRSANWNDAEEKQYKYDIAWEKRDRSNGLSKEDISKQGLVLSEEEKNILADGNPEVRSAYVTYKPIITGNKNDGKAYNDTVLDKLALYPLNYRILKEINPEANALSLYTKMQQEKVDYAVFESARKVGVIGTHSLYNDSNGAFSKKKFVINGENRNIVNIPFDIIGIQTDVPSKDKASTTRGSQITKLLTMDLMEAGIPVDFMEDEVQFNKRYEAWFTLTDEEKAEKSPLFEEIQNNQKLLEALTNVGYYSLLDSLGISETIKKNGTKTFKIKDFSKAANTLREEILKRNVNENVSTALKEFFDKGIALESTPVFKQIVNILYSIADKEVIKQKTTGSMNVQLPVSLLESVKAKGEKVIVKGKEKIVYSSGTLDFYSMTTDDKSGKKTVNVCEIMVGRWFDSPLSDEELINFLNLPENQEILRGVAFRIPTQKQNSIDVFKIKQLLPREFGDNIIVPSEIVAKVGSDFDIDKITAYLKNVIIDKNGYPKLVKLMTDENSTVDDRYTKFLRSKVKEYGSLRKDVQQNSIEGRDFFANINKVYDVFKEKMDLIKAETLSPLSEALDNIKNSITTKSFESQTIFNSGFELFKQLPISVRQQFMELNSDMDKKILEGSMIAFDKTVEFKRYAYQWIKVVDDSRNVDLSYADKKGNKQTERVSSESISTVLEAMIANYDLYLTSIGWTKEVIDDFNLKLQNLKENKISFKETKDNTREIDVEQQKKSIFLSFTREFNNTLADVFNVISLEDFGKKSVLEQNTKEALQNAYVQSSENLASHEKNYDRLVQPNSAAQLKKIAEFIASKTTGSSFDYSDVANMLDRRFMSRLRHAFVTGKYAIGIAAVNQTFHSLKQRANIYIDPSRLKLASESDQYWLEDASIKFEAYNKITIDGKQRISLSKIRNAEKSEKYPNGQDISDINGQFIDGYVDISAGPWIMEIGATPNVTSVWLFLNSAGVPIDTIAYFMNQPIIRDYLVSIETSGYSYLFMKNFVEATLMDYSQGDLVSIQDIRSLTNFKIPTKGVLKASVGKKVDKMNKQELLNQQRMLLEFLKYAKMAEHTFLTTR